LGQEAHALTDGTITKNHPSVGFILFGDDKTCATPAEGEFCTATLVGKRTVLTAAHCLLTSATAVFCLEVGSSSYRVKERIVHPNWDTLAVDNDIGLITLDREPPVEPSGITEAPPAQSQHVMLVGFGSTKAGQLATGDKRIAENRVHQLWSTRFSIKGTGDGVGNVCKGDSGGPVFAEVGDRLVQVGVSSSGSSTCGELAFATRVDVYREWLEKASGGDLAPAKKIFGATCKQGSDCATGTCHNMNGISFCTHTCDPKNDEDACPGEAQCLQFKKKHYCGPVEVVLDDWAGGCGVTAGRAGEGWFAFFFLIVFLLAVRKSR
jgi:secreted trypsin-like serine protease